ncbi:O-acetyl-ADP-ribose deacetylase [Scopulibacillus cellulosilyticus]|uniref:O-acetyl-ADP-ribose deacetylase n=1 Tax=Scopulibacillus cellulosilyticus TaxID=2665665 RepID=A0ABW2PYW9_9BACL
MTAISEKIHVVQGDITRVTVDAIVNAANNGLLGGGGVDGAIHRAGGSEILEECKKIREKQGGCPTGEAVITTAGRLNAKYVIHTVGPVWQGGKHQEAQLLRNCYQNVLQLADQYHVETIAFPNISTGVYHFPKPLAADISAEEVSSYLNEHKQSKINKVLFVCFDEENYRLLLEKTN